MKKSSTIIIACTVWSLCIISCNKWYNAPQVMPPETRNGANTFGCYINDKLFLPASDKQLFGRSPLTFSREEHYITLYARNEKTDQAIIFQMPKSYFGQGKVPHYVGLLDTTGVLARYLLTDEYGTYYGRELATYTDGPGAFRITCYNDSVCSGTFWFDAVDTVAHDTVHIREGRFDVKF